MELVIGIAVALVVVFVLIQVFGQMSLDKPIESWSDEELVRRLPKYEHLLSTQIQASAWEKTTATKAKIDEIRSEIIRRQKVFELKQVESLKQESMFAGKNDGAITEKALVVADAGDGAMFGMSTKDSWLLKQTEIMLAPLGLLTGHDVKPMARQIFDELKADGLKRYGDNIYSESYGDRMVANQPALAKRMATGLTIDDVRNYWNQPVLLGLLQAKVLEVGDFLVIDVARRSGKDIVAVARDRRKREPRYGNPEAWNPSLPANQGFTTDDADIYPEFVVRVGQWQAKVSAEEQATVLAKYTSSNAMVRALIRQGQL